MIARRQAAVPLEAGGGLAGVVVLGPKQTGAAFEDDEIAFLGALSSVAALALHSAGIQRTLEAPITSCATRSRKSPQKNHAF